VLPGLPASRGADSLQIQIPLITNWAGITPALFHVARLPGRVQRIANASRICLKLGIPFIFCNGVNW